MQCWREYHCLTGWNYSLRSTSWSLRRGWNFWEKMPCFLFPMLVRISAVFPPQREHRLGSTYSEGNCQNIYLKTRYERNNLSHFLSLDSMKIMLWFCYWDFLIYRNKWLLEVYLLSLISPPFVYPWKNAANVALTNKQMKKIRFPSTI